MIETVDQSQLYIKPFETDADTITVDFWHGYGLSKEVVHHQLISLWQDTYSLYGYDI